MGKATSKQNHTLPRVLVFAPFWQIQLGRLRRKWYPFVLPFIDLLFTKCAPWKMHCTITRPTYLILPAIRTKKRDQYPTPHHTTPLQQITSCHSITFFQNKTAWYNQTNRPTLLTLNPDG